MTLCIIGCDSTTNEINISIYKPNEDYKISVELNNELTQPEIDEYDALFLEGWYLDSNFSQKITFPVIASDDMSFYAKYNESITVLWIDGESSEEGSALYQTSITYGQEVSYQGITPTRQSEYVIYTFTGFSGPYQLAQIKGVYYYVAQYEEDVKSNLTSNPVHTTDNFMMYTLDDLFYNDIIDNEVISNICYNNNKGSNFDAFGRSINYLSTSSLLEDSLSEELLDKLASDWYTIIYTQEVSQHQGVDWIKSQIKYLGTYGDYVAVELPSYTLAVPIHGFKVVCGYTFNHSGNINEINNIMLCKIK